MTTIAWYFSLCGAFLFGWVACCAFEGMSEGYREAKRIRERQDRLDAMIRSRN